MMTKVNTSDLLFHGTACEIVGELHGGGYDNVFWTAETPDIAQTYIPSCGIHVFVNKPPEYSLNDSIRPDGFWYDLALTLGYEAYDIEYKYNFPCGWIWRDNKSPKIGDLYQYLINDLGYDRNADCLEVKQSYTDDKKVHFYHADYEMPGSLYILKGKENLNIYDYTVGREADLTDLDYHKLSLFRKVEAQGYDGIKIWDFTKTKRFGNVSHVSIGLFPKGIKKLEHEVIAATHFDWKEDMSDFFSQTTPQYSEWLLKQ